MSQLDGTTKELTYGEALCAIVEKVSWSTELIKREVLLAVQKEHGLVPPPPTVLSQPNDPRDTTLANQDREIAERKAAQLETERQLAAANAALAAAGIAPQA